MADVRITSITARPPDVDVAGGGSSTVSVGLMSSSGDVAVVVVFTLDGSNCVYFENGRKESRPYPGVATTIGSSVITPLGFRCGAGAPVTIFDVSAAVSASGTEQDERSTPIVNRGGPCP